MDKGKIYFLVEQGCVEEVQDFLPIPKNQFHRNLLFFPFHLHKSVPEMHIYHLQLSVESGNYIKLQPCEKPLINFIINECVCHLRNKAPQFSFIAMKIQWESV